MAVYDSSAFAAALVLTMLEVMLVRRFLCFATIVI
jgi:hypothetical protein